MQPQTFAKAERLHSKKIIQELFTKGSSFYLHPFKIVLLVNPDQASTNHQILVSVSKRFFKKAVDRNLLKRRIRESFRKEKGNLQVPATLLMAFLYTHKSLLPLTEIQKGMISAIKKINQRISEADSSLLKAKG
jgi:ribonuclease P protein component